MKRSMRWIVAVFGVVALAAAVFGVYTAMENRDALPILVKPSQGAARVATDMLQAVADGDYDKAGTMILGEPDLGVDREADGAVGQFLWNAYQESLEFEAVGELFTTKEGVAQRYTVRYLDVNSVAANLREYSRALLQERVEQAEDVTEVYDENHEYREELVSEVLCEAAKMALEKDAAYKEETFVLNLTYRDGNWWVVLDNSLLTAISGGLVG